jgi:predicted phosphoribosyltransferase
MFQNREDAALQLADKLRDRSFRDPLVLGIPRGGVVIAAVLARELGADLDVVLARKLRAPGQPELAIGAISETGEVFLNRNIEEGLDLPPGYLAEERAHQLAEITRRQRIYRRARPQAPVAARSVILTDDGIATGSTMIAALQVVRKQQPHELIVAAPVASPDRLDGIRRWCDEIVCVLLPEMFWAIGQFYEDFAQVSDEEVVHLLRQFAPVAS